MDRAQGTRIALALAGLLAISLSFMAGSAAAEHPAERVLMLVVDGPRHDLAFDEEGAFSPLYDHESVAFAEDVWTAGPAKTVPGHAALLTGSPQAIENDGSEGPGDPLLWDALAQAHGWGPEEMMFLYQKGKLGVLASENVGGGQVTWRPPDEAMLKAIDENRTDLETGLLVATFAWPDTTGHDGDWEAHEASLETIGEGFAAIVQAEADADTLILATADHARSCKAPTDHGRPMGPSDDCDANIPLWAAGWHVPAGARIDACLTQADVGVLVAEALDAKLEDANGRFPTPLVDAHAADDWEDHGCPPTRGNLPFGVPAFSAGMSALTMTAAALGSMITSRHPRPR